MHEYDYEHSLKSDTVFWYRPITLVSISSINIGNIIHSDNITNIDQYYMVNIVSGLYCRYILDFADISNHGYGIIIWIFVVVKN